MEIGQRIARSREGKFRTRYDFEIIADIIECGSNVIDIGCGNGELLMFLKEAKRARIRGIELLESNVSRALMRGIPVVQGDAEVDLASYPEKSFDYAILSQTIQMTRNPPKILTEMLRIANKAVVSFPNFAHFGNRLQLTFRGQMPVNKNIPYQWYETPNIHFCSIRDFDNLCIKLGFSVERRVFLTDFMGDTRRLDSLFPFQSIANLCANLFAEFGIFVITKNELAAITQAEFVEDLYPINVEIQSL